MSINTAFLAYGRDHETTTALTTTLRFALRVINYIFALLGIAALGYAIYLCGEMKHREGISSYPWFLFTFGAVGILVFVTASTALVGIARNSRFFLGMYGFLVTMILIAQAALAILFFTDNTWKKHIPPDPTGEQKEVEKFLKDNLNVMKWIGLAILVIEVISILIAYCLSSAQQRLVAQMSDDEDELWGRRSSLSHRKASNDSATGPSSSGTAPRRMDPWSERMRQKYALDTSTFTYDPEEGDQQLAHQQEVQEQKPQQWCRIM